MDALVARASALVAPPKGILATGPGGAALSGRPLPEAIGAAGLMTGVRANTGRHPLPGTRGETITEGLDGLPARLDGWARRGTVFATWRAVLRIGPGTPSPVAVPANAQALGRYAAACQAAGLVPLVAPHLDVGGLRSPARSSLAHSETVMSRVLLAVVSELHRVTMNVAAMEGHYAPELDVDAA